MAQMPIDLDTQGYRRYLPHLVTSDATYFVTFCTFGRWTLPPDARDIVLRSCIYDHRTLHWLHVATVMPDHVHLVTTPYENVKPAEVIGAIKSASAHIVKRVCGRQGHVWFRESFDHIVRREESLTTLMEYVAMNPVRAGLVKRWGDYPWTWMAERDDDGRPPRAAASTDCQADS